MRKPSRPSPALIVALVALVAALGGTALAGPVLHDAKKKKHKKQAGDKIIKKRSLSGNRLKAKTVTGAEVDVSKLGTVPSAANAGHAGNADKLGGKGPGAFAPAARMIASGLIKQTSAASTDQPVTLVQSGPFSIASRCFDSSGGTVTLEMRIESSEAGAVYRTDSPGEGTGVSALSVVLSLKSTSAATSLHHTLSAVAPSGATLAVTYQGMVHTFGADCASAVNGTAGA